jgi:rare lipoprotein A
MHRTDEVLKTRQKTTANLLKTVQSGRRRPIIRACKKIICFLLVYGCLSIFISDGAMAQDSVQKKTPRILYGTASYYANKFQGRKTANGEIFDQNKMTAACNVLPLGTWIQVTNLRNKKTVVVKVNDRLHTRMKRIVDLSRAAATKLGYLNAGLTRVKVEVLGKKKPAQ